MQTSNHTFAVGGIYGRLSVLEAALAAIAERADRGTVIFLGNYGHGGDEAVHVVDRLMGGPSPGWNWVCLLGSYDSELIEPLHPNHLPGMRIASYGPRTCGTLDYGVVPSRQLEWLTRLPNLHEDRFRVYVHAGVDDAFGPAEQPAETALYRVYEATDATGYRGRHLVHAHVASSTPTTGSRTSLELPGFGSLGTLVAMFDDDKAGGPADIVQVGGTAPPARDAASVGTAARLREALAFEEAQLARLRIAIARNDLDDVQRVIWPSLANAHQRAIFEYRQRLANIDLHDFMQALPMLWPE